MFHLFLKEFQDQPSNGIGYQRSFQYQLGFSKLDTLQFVRSSQVGHRERGIHCRNLLGESYDMIIIPNTSYPLYLWDRLEVFPTSEQLLMVTLLQTSLCPIGSYVIDDIYYRRSTIFNFQLPFIFFVCR